MSKLVTRGKDLFIHDFTYSRLSSELADIETKLNFSRDSVELHMLQFLSKESEVIPNMFAC